MDIEKLYDQNQAGAWTPPSEEDTKLFQMRCKAGPTFSEAAPDLMRDTVVKTVCFWDITEKVLKDAGITWKPQYQKHGTCVGQGAATAVDDLQCLHVAKEGLKFEGRAAVAGTYAGGRVEVANRPGRWDGSNCTWSGQALVDVGILFKKHLSLPEDDLDEDEKLAVKWAASREGIPEQYETLANGFTVAKATLCKTTEELAVALNNLCTAFQGSQSYATGKCDEHGISPLRSGGGHAQAIRGVVIIDGRRYFAEQNSWGPNWAPGYKGEFRVPPGCVLLSETDMQRQLNARDCIVLSGPRGFVKQSLDFRIL